MTLYPVRDNCMLVIICVCSMTEAKVERKEDDSNSEEQARRVDLSPAAASQPQRVALFPGMDPSVLKVSINLCDEEKQRR